MGSLLVLVHGTTPTREDVAGLEDKVASLEDEVARLEGENERMRDAVKKKRRGTARTS